MPQDDLLEKADALMRGMQRDALHPAADPAAPLAPDVPPAAHDDDAIPVLTDIIEEGTGPLSDQTTEDGAQAVDEPFSPLPIRPAEWDEPPSQPNPFALPPPQSNVLEEARRIEQALETLLPRLENLLDQMLNDRLAAFGAQLEERVREIVAQELASAGRRILADGEAGAGEKPGEAEREPI